jgi:BirA family biotin operon repressor/biotin-[acetyl-CoA-carboxylase] ligase
MSLPSEPLSAESIRAAISAAPLVEEVVYLPRAESTNDVAHDLAAGGAPHATLVVTDHQVAGRGRMGRSWYTPPNTALAMSLVLRPELDARHAQRLTMLAGLAAVEGIESIAELEAGLKWPNDVIGGADMKKIGGILTETSIADDRIHVAVVGIGLNVNVDFYEQPELDLRATSLMALAGHPLDRLQVLAAVVERFAARYAQLARGEPLARDWAARLVTLGKRIEAQMGDRVLIGRAEQVDADGALLLRDDAGSLHRLLAAEVTIKKT